VLDVLARGAASLAQVDDAAATPTAAPRPRLFEFVRNAAIRPVLDQAFADSGDAFERGEFALALILSCSVIEALLTDALEHAARNDRTNEAGSGLAGWSFHARIAEAERVGLVRGGCARLPPIARSYRDLTDADGELRADSTVSERDARIAGQVLRVVMRDLDP